MDERDETLEPFNVFVQMPEISRCLSKGDPCGAYDVLRDLLPVGIAGPALVALVRTVDDWPQRVMRRYPSEKPYLKVDRSPSGPAKITERDFYVLCLVAEGLTDLEIGEGLSVAPDTVKTHVKKLHKKFGTRNRAHLVAEAYRTGVLDRHDPGPTPS